MASKSVRQPLTSDIITAQHAKMVFLRVAKKVIILQFRIFWQFDSGIDCYNLDADNRSNRDANKSVMLPNKNLTLPSFTERRQIGRYMVVVVNHRK